jgi:toxin ParE1/3/4
MSWRVVVRRLARADFERACKYYDRESRDLGHRFMMIVNEALRQIAANLLQYPAVYRDLRRVVLHPFSYALYSKAGVGTVRIFAVIHTSRAPRIWQDRA